MSRCKECDIEVSDEQALKTYSDVGYVLCEKHEIVMLKQRLGIDTQIKSNGSKTDDDKNQDPIPAKNEGKKPAGKTPGKPGKPTNPADDNKTAANNSGSDKPDTKTEVNNTPEKPGTPLLNHIKKIVGNDLCEIFGESGEGKSKFVHTIAVEAKEAGLKLFYLDSERNLSDHEIEALGDSYKYTPRFKEIQQIISKLGDYDLIVIDSVGLPALNQYARLKMKGKGDLLLSFIALMADLKEWSYDHNAIVLATNQPESEFNKETGYERRPFGDKAQFNFKEVWKIKKDKKSTNGVTKCTLKSFKSREMAKDTLIASMEISENGVDILIRGMDI